MFNQSISKFYIWCKVSIRVLRQVLCWLCINKYSYSDCYVDFLCMRKNEKYRHIKNTASYAEYISNNSWQIIDRCNFTNIELFFMT